MLTKNITPAVIETERSKGKFFSAAATLFTVVAVLVVGWLILQILQVVVPVLNYIYLVLAGLWIAKLLFAPRTVYSPEDRQKTWRQITREGMEARMRTGQEKLSDKEFNVYATVVLAGMGVLYFLFYTLLTASFLSFATTERFQVFPLNWLGAAAVIVSGATALQAIPVVYRVYRSTDKKNKNTSVGRFLAIKLSALTALSYIIGIFLVLVGVIK